MLYNSKQSESEAEEKIFVVKGGCQRVLDAVWRYHSNRGELMIEHQYDGREKGVGVCICNFSFALIKHHDKKQLRKERVHNENP